MNTETIYTNKEKMLRALSALRLEVAPCIADDVKNKVLDYVVELEAERDKLKDDLHHLFPDKY